MTHLKPLDSQFVTNRLGRFRNSYLTLMHLHVAFVSIAFASYGALISNSWYWDRFVVGTLGILIAKQGLYLIDEATGRQWGTGRPGRELWTAGLALLVVGVLFSVYLILEVPSFIYFVVVGGILAFLYNARIMPTLFHTYWNFGLTWAALPFLAGYYVMAQQLRFSLLVAGVALAIFAMLIQIFSDTLKIGTLGGTLAKARLGMELMVTSTFVLLIAISLWRLGI